MGQGRMSPRRSGLVRFSTSCPPAAEAAAPSSALQDLSPVCGNLVLPDHAGHTVSRFGGGEKHLGNGVSNAQGCAL